MSTTTYQRNSILTSFPRRKAPLPPISNRVKHFDTNVPLQAKHSINPIASNKELLSKDSADTPSSVEREILAKTISKDHSNSEKTTPIQTEQQTYTFCNPPREIVQNRKLTLNNRLHHRISSAPDENFTRKSLRSNSIQRKPLSANGSSKPHSSSDTNNELSVQANHSLIYDQRKRESFENLVKQNKKPKIPEIVQKRRKLIALYNSTSPRNKQNPSAISNNNQIETRDSPIIPANKSNTISPSNSITMNALQNSQSSDNAETDIDDSMQLAAILREIALEDNWLPSEASSKSQSTFDLSKYEYVVASPTNTATLRLSPSMMKADEEFARKRFFQNCQHEMALSANSGIPTLMVSMVSDFNSTIGGNVTEFEHGLIYKIKSPDAIAKQNSVNNAELLESTADDVSIQLCFDATLKRFYDPNTGKYYELI